MLLLHLLQLAQYSTELRASEAKLADLKKEMEDLRVQKGLPPTHNSKLMLLAPTCNSGVPCSKCWLVIINFTTLFIVCNPIKMLLFAVLLYVSRSARG